MFITLILMYTCVSIAYGQVCQYPGHFVRKIIF